MQNPQNKKLIIELEGKSCKAFFEDNPSVYGIGKTRAEATAAIYNYTIGKLILEDPDKFGFEIIDRT